MHPPPSVFAGQNSNFKISCAIQGSGPALAVWRAPTPEQIISPLFRLVPGQLSYIPINLEPTKRARLYVVPAYDCVVAFKCCRSVPCLAPDEHYVELVFGEAIIHHLPFLELLFTTGCTFTPRVRRLQLNQLSDVPLSTGIIQVALLRRRLDSLLGTSLLGLANQLFFSTGKLDFVVLFQYYNIALLALEGEILDASLS